MKGIIIMRNKTISLAPYHLLSMMKIQQMKRLCFQTVKWIITAGWSWKRKESCRENPTRNCVSGIQTVAPRAKIACVNIKITLHQCLEKSKHIRFNLSFLTVLIFRLFKAKICLHHQLSRSGQIHASLRIFHSWSVDCSVTFCWNWCGWEICWSTPEIIEFL